MEGADTALTFDVAVLAIPVALVVAANAVNTVVRGTFDICITRRPDNLLQDAVRSIAPVSSNAVVSFGAHLQTINGGIVTDVRRAGAVTLVNALADTITKVIGMLDPILAVLRETDAIWNPQSASASAVAGTVIVTGGDGVFCAVVFGVVACFNRNAGDIAVTNLAENAFVFGVSVGGNGSTGTDKSIKCTGVATRFTTGVAAVAVHALVGETFELIVAGLAIVLLRQAVVAVAVVVFVAVRLHRTVSTAGDVIAIADVGFTLGEALVDAESIAIAEVRRVFDGAFAELVEADSAVDPEAASTSTVAGTVILAVCGVEHFTVAEGILTHEHWDTAAVTVAHVAEATFGFRVSTEVITGTSTLESAQSTALARIFTSVVAAVAINTLIRKALEAVGASLAIFLLVETDLAFAVVERLAIDLDCTGEEAIGTFFVADVRNTVYVGKVDAGSNPVTEVFRILEDSGTRLVKTGCGVVPKLASVVAITVPVETTSRSTRLGTFFLRVNTRCRCLTGAIAIADAAQATFVLGVTIVEVV